MKQTSKPKELTENEKQRAVLASLLVCPVCGGERRYNKAVGFTCDNWLHEWQGSISSKKLAAKLGAGKKRRIK